MPSKERRIHHSHREKIRLDERPMNESEENGMGFTYWLSSYSKKGERTFEIDLVPQRQDAVIAVRTTHLKPTANGALVTLRKPPVIITADDLKCIDDFNAYATSDPDSFDTDIERSKKIHFARPQIIKIRRLLNAAYSPTEPFI